MPKKTFSITLLSGKNQRLDIFLAERIGELSRSQVKKLVEGQKIRVDGNLRKSSYKLNEGERVEIDYELPKVEKIAPENIPLKFIYSDEHIGIIDKPSGLVVHPGAGSRQSTLVNALLFHFPDIERVGPEDRPGIVHRLDKETSGLIVVARTLKSFSELQRQFKAREVEKLYQGLVWGKISKPEGRINWAIGRHVRHGERMSIKTKKPREAVTLYTVLKKFKEFTLLEIKPITGRTHQIRVHFSAAGHPIVGDTRYGRRKTKILCPRLFLHAFRLAFFHPESNEKVEFSSPLPDDLKNFLLKIEE